MGICQEKQTCKKRKAARGDASSFVSIPSSVAKTSKIRRIRFGESCGAEDMVVDICMQVASSNRQGRLGKRRFMFLLDLFDGKHAGCVTQK